MNAAELDALACRAKEGDRAALALLFDETAELRQRIMQRQSRRRQGWLDNEDLQQQGYLILAAIVEGWRRRGPFLPWLLKLYPLALLQYRRRCLRWHEGRHQSLDSPQWRAQLERKYDAVLASGDPAGALLDTVLCQQLLAELPVAHRRLLRWRYGDCLSYRQIELQHGVAAATAQLHCRKALAWLRARASGQTGPPLPPLHRRPAGNTYALRGVLCRLWQLAADGDGLLPPAGSGATALGLGRRQYDLLLAQLSACGCLAYARGVTFHSHLGRRRQTMVDCEEAWRRLRLCQTGAGAADAIMPGHG